MSNQPFPISIVPQMEDLEKAPNQTLAVKGAWGLRHQLAWHGTAWQCMP